MGRRIVFLDFDGVLNSHEYLLSMSGRSMQSEAEDLDPVNVARLNRIVAASGAEVVISSSWRYGRSVEALAAMLAERGFEGKVIDKTPDWSSMTDGNVYVAEQRGDEIKAWLDERGAGVTAFVVLDDDNDMDAVRACHVRTSLSGGGLLDEHVEVALRVLLGP
jgi:hypothetical protein